MVTEYFDVVIVGAGLSGIGAAWHLQHECPDLSFVILESRDAIGGTWDLFRYPGIRSDSDMHTLGYRFKPWREAKAIADGPSILRYVRETAAENGIDRHIRFRHRLAHADWSTERARWTAQVARRDESGNERTVEISCNFLLLCAGYYNYRQGHSPEFPGRERFRGALVHPQFWPQDLDYADKRVVVIGSGATAMTLVPELAKEAAEVVMLQRSPTYVISRPARDRIANALRLVLPQRWAYALTRWKNTRLQQWLYRRTRVAPEKVKRLLLTRVREELGPDYDVATHFTPDYNPWDQRLCLVPDGDLFAAIRSGRAKVVTAEIDRFTDGGIRLRSGEELAADIIVTATGLELAVMGGATFSVDGAAVDFSRQWTYKGLMCSDVPNLVVTFGYINASWTLRADLTAQWVCRVLGHMAATGTRQVTPRLPAALENMQPRPWIEDFAPGYMQRAMHLFPQQGDRAPWINPQNYRADRRMFLSGPLEDGALQFTRPGDAAAAEPSRPLRRAG